MFSFFFFVILIFCNSWNLQTWIYFIFLSNIRRRNTSWIPAFAGMTKISRGNDHKETLRSQNTDMLPECDWGGVILESTPAVILEIFYRGSRPIFYKYNLKRRSLQTKIKICTIRMTGTSCISWNQLLRIPVFTSFFVFSDQNRNLFFFLFYSKRKISWIPAFAGMT